MFNSPARASRIAAALYSKRHETTAFVYRREDGTYTWSSVDFSGRLPDGCSVEFIYSRGELIKERDDVTRRKVG